MNRARPGLIAGILIAAVVFIAACGLFAIQNAQAYAQCSGMPGPAPCAAVSPIGEAGSAVFVAVGALMVAIVMAITVGVNARTDTAPNVALARQIEAEDAAYKRAKERYEELKELNRLALAHAQGQAGDDGLPADGDTADAQVSVSEILGASAGAGSLDPEWQEQPHQETADERRRRVTQERLRNLARQKPDTVAEVLKTWINQPRALR